MALTKTPIELSSTPGIVDNSNATAITIDSSENVGIGTSSPSRQLTVQNSGNAIAAITSGTSSSSFLLMGDTDSDNIGMLKYNNADNSLGFYAGSNSSERMRIDSSGRVGIGCSPSEKLQVDGNIRIGDTATGTNDDEEYSITSGGQLLISANDSAADVSYSGLILNAGKAGGAAASSSLVMIKTNDAERMRIDSSGNLLVGTTSTDTAAVGFRYRSSLDAISSVADGGVSAYFGRRSSFGDIVTLRKDDATVGNIGTPFTGELYIAASGANSSGLLLTESNAVRPMKNGSASDATQDLGRSNGRWKDLYLSGGVYLGGTGAANKLDDYETGTWTPVAKSNTTVIATNVGFAKYTKIGNIVHVTCHVTRADSASLSGIIHIYGLPFTVLASSTQVNGSIWFDNSGTDEVTTVYYGSNASYLLAKKVGASNDYTTAATFANTRPFYFSGTYMTA